MLTTHYPRLDTTIIATEEWQSDLCAATHQLVNGREENLAVEPNITTNHFTGYGLPFRVEWVGSWLLEHYKLLRTEHAKTSLHT